MAGQPRKSNRGLEWRKFVIRRGPDPTKLRHSRSEGGASGLAFVIDRYQYLLLLVGCLLVTLPLELLLGARVYRRPRRLALAVLPVAAVFTLWDVVAIARDHWTYSARFTTGWRLPLDVPVEEIAFFVVIPVCGLLTYEAVGLLLARIQARSARRV